MELVISYLQAFAEWILFTSSGIASGLYHACDVGTWCALNFNVLQVTSLSLVVSLTVFSNLEKEQEKSWETKKCFGESEMG